MTIDYSKRHRFFAHDGNNHETYTGTQIFELQELVSPITDDYEY